jgi:hypothetical protein
MSANGVAFLSLLATVAAVIVAIAIYRLQRDRKNLDWDLISATKLLRDDASPIRDLELRYKGDIIANPYLLQLKFINTGNKPVTSEDYEHPLRVHIDTDSRILSAEVVESSQADMDAKISTLDQEATLQPLLLNPGDWVSCQILLDRPPKRWKVKGRIVGVREIRPYKASRREVSPLAKTALTILGIATFLGTILASSNESLVARFPFVKWMAYVMLGAALLVLVGILILSIYQLFSASEKA